MATGKSLNLSNEQSREPKVAVVLCTWNGRRYIDAQLDSLLKQEWPIRVLAFDDASTDGTYERLCERLEGSNHECTRQERNVGHGRNFEAGLAHALTSGHDYIALCDQDDVWDSRRVASGMQRVLEREASGGPSLPLLAHSDLAVTDESGRRIADSYLAWRGYRLSARRDLALALGENGVMGNTILVNRALAQLVLPFPEGLPVHDYWLGVLAECFGERLFIPDALVSYRVHASNASGKQQRMIAAHERKPLATRLLRLLRLDLRLPFKNDSRLAALRQLLDDQRYAKQLAAEQREVLELFVDYLSAVRPGPAIARSMLAHQFLPPERGRRWRFLVAASLSRHYG